MSVSCDRSHCLSDLKVEESTAAQFPSKACTCSHLSGCVLHSFWTVLLGDSLSWLRQVFRGCRWADAYCCNGVAQELPDCAQSDTNKQVNKNPNPSLGCRTSCWAFGWHLSSRNKLFTEQGPEFTEQGPEFMEQDPEFTE